MQEPARDPRRLSQIRRSKEGYRTWLRILRARRLQPFVAAEKERTLNRDRFISSPHSTTPSLPSPICRATQSHGLPQEAWDSEAPRSPLPSQLRPLPKLQQEQPRSTVLRSLRFTLRDPVKEEKQLSELYSLKSLR